MRRSPVWIVALAALTIASSQALAAGSTYLMYEEMEDGLPAGWEVQDTNADGLTWEPFDTGGTRGTQSLRMLTGQVGPADDWVWSPVLSLNPGEQYTLRFFYRVTSAEQAHALSIYSVPGSLPSPPGDLVFEDLQLDSPEATEVIATFTATATEHRLGFHCLSEPGRFALFLDRIIVERKVADLQIQAALLQQIRFGSSTYAAGDGIDVLVTVANISAGPMVVNGRLAVGQEQDPDAVLAFRVEGPDGLLREANRKYKMALAGATDLKTLAPGEAVYKIYSLDAGGFDLTAPGPYTLTAVYENVQAPGNAAVFMGELIADPIIFTIQ